MKRLLLVPTLLSLFVAVDAPAQTRPGEIFSRLDLSVAVNAVQSLNTNPRGVANRRIVGMRLDRLFDGGTERVLLNVDNEDWVAVFGRFDGDVLGHRSWVGTIEGIENSSVVFAERNGVVSGAIDGVRTKYQIGTITPGVYTLDRVLEIKTGDETNDAISVAGAASGRAVQSASPANDTAASIDVLLLWTPAARASNTPDGMRALAAQIISQSNDAYGRSGITTRLRLVDAAEWPYAETPPVYLQPGAAMSADLSNLRSNSGIAAARNTLGADLVQLLVASNDAPCGIAYLLNGDSSFGFSVADVACVSQYTPTHELAHNQGSHHAPEDVCAAPCTPTGGAYSYSYGYKDPDRAFRTIMAYACSGVNCPRTLNFSNPSVNHQSGFATGTAAQDNARSINNTAAAVANFRQSTSIITVPAAPTGLTSQVNGQNVTIAWNAVTADVGLGTSAATGYTIQVGTAPDAYDAIPGLPLGNTTTISGSVPLGTYHWRVIASNSAGNGPPSTEAQFTVGGCTAPGAPQNFTHSVGFGRVVSLSWAAPPTGAGPFAYTIDVGSATGRTDILSAPVGGVTTLAVTAPPGTYFVRVRAANACASTSPDSNERMIVVP